MRGRKDRDDGKGWGGNSSPLYRARVSKVRSQNTESVMHPEQEA